MPFGVVASHDVERAGDLFVGEFFGEVFDACDVIGCPPGCAVDAQFAVYAESEGVLLHEA